MGILLILTLLVGIGIGVVLSVTTGWASSLRGKDRKELVISKKNLSTAEGALRRIANPATANPTLEADIALSEIDQNNYYYLKGN